MGYWSAANVKYCHNTYKFFRIFAKFSTQYHMRIVFQVIGTGQVEDPTLRYVDFELVADALIWEGRTTDSKLEWILLHELQTPSSERVGQLFMLCLGYYVIWRLWWHDLLFHAVQILRKTDGQQVSSTRLMIPALYILMWRQSGFSLGPVPTRSLYLAKYFRYSRRLLWICLT